MSFKSYTLKLMVYACELYYRFTQITPIRKAKLNFYHMFLVINKHKKRNWSQNRPQGNSTNPTTILRPTHLSRWYGQQYISPTYYTKLYITAVEKYIT